MKCVSIYDVNYRHDHSSSIGASFLNNSGQHRFQPDFINFNMAIQKDQYLGKKENSQIKHANTDQTKMVRNKKNKQKKKKNSHLLWLPWHQTFWHALCLRAVESLTKPLYLEILLVHIHGLDHEHHLKNNGYKPVNYKYVRMAVSTFVCHQHNAHVVKCKKNCFLYT